MYEGGRRMPGLMTLGSLALNFLWVGAVGFGGGFAMIPLMKSAVLSHHWLTTGGFDQAIAMGQITPGPVAISATFIGERVGGVLGAVVATVAVFLPSTVAIVVLSRSYARLRQVPGTRNVLLATLSGVVGLIAGVTVELGRAVIAGWPELAASLAVFLVAIRLRLPYWAIILAAGAGGAWLLRPG
jgi:chromate transporter